jgi:hypothetical protein
LISSLRRTPARRIRMPARSVCHGTAATNVGGAVAPVLVATMCLLIRADSCDMQPAQCVAGVQGMSA